LDEAIEERGFARVGASDDGEGEAVADHAAVGKGLFERGEGGVNRLYLRGDLSRGEEVDVVFGEVDSGFEGGDEGDESFFRGRDLAGEGAAELPGGEAGLVEGAGFDEVVDGLGLGEVEAAGEEGALGEFAGFGEACAAGEALAEEVVEEDGGAVGGYFYDVFRGVGVGGWEPGYDGFVQDLRGIFPCGVNNFCEAGERGGEGVAEAEEGFGDGAGGGAGEPDDADAAAAGRGGDGDDGVFGADRVLLFGLLCQGIALRKWQIFFGVVRMGLFGGFRRFRGGFLWWVDGGKRGE
jgi:hypothetical protein